MFTAKILTCIAIPTSQNDFFLFVCLLFSTTTMALPTACLQGLLLEGGSAQFRCNIYVKTASAPGSMLSGQTGKPNSILKTAVLWSGFIFSK